MPSNNPAILSGYVEAFNSTKALLAAGTPAVEILLGLMGTPSGVGSVGVSVALQHPFSQGQIFISSSNATLPPSINPNYFSHASDYVILRQGAKLAREVGAALGLKTELSPGLSVQNDQDWETWLRSSVNTEYHPSGTCAMLPKEKGGVVDGNLKVYGLGKLRNLHRRLFD